MPMRYMTSTLGRLGSLLLALSLIGSCGTANPTSPPEQPATRIEPTHAPTSKPSPSQGEEPRPVAGASSTEKASGHSSPATGRGILAFSRDTRTRPADGMVTLYVPGRSFQMGSTESEVEEAIALCTQHYTICNRWYYMREHPQHHVSLADFWLDQTEVTNAQYRRCVEDGVCEEPTECKEGKPTYADPDQSDHPVVCVSWQNARDYCHWAGARMPTEAEWAYASRGEQGRIFPWGDLFDGAMLNYCDANCTATHADTRYDDGFATTSPVGSFPKGASWIGAMGMGGNVSEWVGDWLGEYTPEAESNPTGPSEGSEKLVKGGSWFFHPTYCRGAARASIVPGTRTDFLGFRCATSLGE